MYISIIYNVYVNKTFLYLNEFFFCETYLNIFAIALNFIQLTGDLECISHFSAFKYMFYDALVAPCIYLVYLYLVNMLLHLPSFLFTFIVGYINIGLECVT